MTQNASISVIIPIYNAAGFLADALRSVHAQAYQPLEIILVDDGSTDHIDDVLPSLGPGIVFLRQPNRGPAAARNLGIQSAKGDFLAFLDADDRWPDCKLKIQSDYLKQHPDVSIVLGYVRYILLEGSTRLEHWFVEEYGDISHVHLGSGLYRRNAFEQIGVFDENMPQGEDLDWFMRVRESTISMVVLPDVTLLYHRHTANMTRDTGASQRGVLTTIRKSLERRRKLGTSARELRPWTSYMKDRND
jgi:glycosyltransferase involved in cell wall biosynthesis